MVTMNHGSMIKFMIVEVSHSVYNIVGRLFSLEQNSIWLCGQAFASFQHGLFMSEEMLHFLGV